MPGSTNDYPTLPTKPPGRIKIVRKIDGPKAGMYRQRHGNESRCNHADGRDSAEAERTIALPGGRQHNPFGYHTVSGRWTDLFNHLGEVVKDDLPDDVHHKILYTITERIM